MEGIQSQGEGGKFTIGIMPARSNTDFIGVFYGRNWTGKFVLVESCYDLSNTKAWAVLQGADEIWEMDVLAVAQVL